MRIRPTVNLTQLNYDAPKEGKFHVELLKAIKVIGPMGRLYTLWPGIVVSPDDEGIERRLILDMLQSKKAHVVKTRRDCIVEGGGAATPKGTPFNIDILRAHRDMLRAKK